MKINVDQTPVTEMESAFIIRVRYHGPTNYKGSRYSYRWMNWPASGKQWHTQFAATLHDYREQYMDAANELVAFLENGMPDYPKRYVKKITFAGWGTTNDTFLMVNLDHY